MAKLTSGGITFEIRNLQAIDPEAENPRPEAPIKAENEKLEAMERRRRKLIAEDRKNTLSIIRMEIEMNGWQFGNSEVYLPEHRDELLAEYLSKKLAWLNPPPPPAWHANLPRLKTD